MKGILLKRTNNNIDSVMFKNDKFSWTKSAISHLATYKLESDWRW